jgi:hypothetical protein
VIRGETEEASRAYIARMISSGKAAPTDLFIDTGIYCRHMSDGPMMSGAAEKLEGAMRGRTFHITFALAEDSEACDRRFAELIASG